jgi:antitoxin component of MazEF toxin-antitoxin module
MSQATIGRWRRSLAIRLPASVARKAGLAEHQHVVVEAEGDTVLIRPAAPGFTLAELFAGRTPAQWRGAYADAYGWGPDIGREAVAE